ncbi:ABC transporter permease [Aquisalibacillus elongatus]|uniref:Peptide/nickel transport system permease protein n=1 Tax=Aquisalibacillus elongatus TaxID=485577 RepID=A0A3N5BFK9_9BACI|nr:ABC transporter permease [Aquisalibacillus elongatus]RPF54070.1 peptide/nickel transport system permease protein [Aquisalibacillus elongatus]
MSENHSHKDIEQQVSEQQKEQEVQKSPSGLRIFWREILKDKLALISLIFFVLVSMIVFGISLILDLDEVVKIDPFAIHQPPSDEFLLGTDKGGRDVFGQLIIGTRNSLAIGFLVTLISGAFGIIFGVVSGYFGGHIDNFLMRIVDFFMVLPFIMIIIVFVTIVPRYSVWTFSLIMSAFIWMGIARLIRSKALQERELDYAQASRTLGSSHTSIIFKQVLPNITSLVVVTMTLNLAANIGIESGLSFLGFGLPEDTPSLGTLMSYATNPTTLEERWWIWAPAAALILVLMLAVRNVGEALKRAADARQRRA